MLVEYYQRKTAEHIVKQQTSSINWNQQGLILIPWHQPEHWQLVVIDMTKTALELHFWDSLGGKSNFATVSTQLNTKY